MKKLLIAIVVTFIAVSLTDFLFHQVLLKGTYAATKSHWRSEQDIQSMVGWMSLAHLMIAVGFAMIYVKALAEKACIKCALGYGFSMGLVSAGGQLMMYAVQPFPGSLIAKWVAICMVQSVFLALVLFYTCKSGSGAKDS